MTTLLPLSSELDFKIASTTTSLNDYADLLERELEKNPNDIDIWNRLFDAIDHTIADNVSQEDSFKSTLSDEVQTKIYNTYKTLLLRFPYLDEIWKKWLVVEFKLKGLDASVDILRMAVESFPYSVSLWVDYLTALKSIPGTNPEQFRSIYREALRYNEFHFSSHPIWDKAIEFETESEPNSKRLLSLYLKVIKIPLYQYAQYYSQFTEINKNFDIHELMGKEILIGYVEKFGKSKVEDLSLIEKHQIIDDFFATVFASTQAKVSSNWEYEQQLLHQEFSFDRKEIEEERNVWLEYTNREIASYDACKDKNQYDLICNLFERALIPNCFDEELWLKYIKFIEESSLAEEEKREIEKEIYLRANGKFIPLNQCMMRKLYAYFLLKKGEIDLAIEYLFDWMKLLSGTSKQYFKSPYLEMTREILQIWKKLLSQGKFQEALEFVIENYFGKPQEKRVKSEANKESRDRKLYQLSDTLLHLFARFLNDDSIPIVIEYSFDIYVRQRESTKIRNFFNKHHKETSLLRSLSFWKFMFEYEGVIENNLSNLKLIEYLIRIESQLPKSAIDMFVDWYYDIASANISELLVINKGRSDDSMILKELQLSNSVFYNASTRKRMARSNYRVLDSPGYEEDPEQRYLDLCSKQAGHPAVFVDANPEITNSFLNGGKQIDLTKNTTPVPPLPTFKGVEKVQALAKRKSHKPRTSRS